MLVTGVGWTEAQPVRSTSASSTIAARPRSAVPFAASDAVLPQFERAAARSARGFRMNTRYQMPRINPAVLAVKAMGGAVTSGCRRSSNLS